MNVLDYLTQKKNDSAVHSHPLAHNSAAFKYTYCFGLAVLVYGYKDQLPITVECFSSILNNINIDNEQRKKLSLQVKNNFDLKINDVFSQISEKNEQYCFIADLYRLSFFGLISPAYCHDIIDGYMQVFNFTLEEKNFLQEFTELGYQTESELKKQTLSYYDTKLNTAINIYQSFQHAGYNIKTSILEYIYPSFSLTNEINHFVLDDGSIRRFESNLRVDGNNTIANCSTVIIDHAHVRINGKINVENGKILIRNSDILIEDCPSDYLLTIDNTPSIVIENSTIDCNHKCAFLSQSSGQLKIQHSTIKNTVEHEAIRFTGNSADISTTNFSSCMHGAFFNNAKKELFIGSSHFNDCRSIHGGAIHSRSTANTTIYNCSFTDCHAQYIGGAIYFVNLKYGQSIISCNFKNCTPSDSTLFNAYERTQEDAFLTR